MSETSTPLPLQNIRSDDAMSLLLIPSSRPSSDKQQAQRTNGDNSLEVILGRQNSRLQTVLAAYWDAENGFSA